MLDEEWQGVRENVPNAVLEGWNLHYQQPYTHKTTQANLDPGQGKCLLVAARKVGSSHLALAAVGERCVVLEDRKDQFKEVLWIFGDRSD